MMDQIWIYLLVAAAILLVIFNLYQLTSAMRKKKAAELKLTETESKITALKKDLEKQKAELKDRIMRRMK